MSKIGHNGVAADQLRTIIERVERLEQERSELAEDIKDIFKEAKGNGFDVATIKKVIQLRCKEAPDLEEMFGLLGVYMSAIGMQLTLPGFSVGDEE